MMDDLERALRAVPMIAERDILSAFPWATDFPALAAFALARLAEKNAEIAEVTRALHKSREKCDEALAAKDAEIAGLAGLARALRDELALWHKPVACHRGDACTTERLLTSSGVMAL